MADGPPSPLSETVASRSLYAGYHDWKGWDALFTYDAAAAGYFSGELRDVALSGARVLEIGFGSGSLLAWAKDQGANLYGTEIAGTSIEAAEQFGVTLLPADLSRAASDYGDHFDTVIAFDVFEHLSFTEIDAALMAVSTMLRPGGRLVLRFPNGQSPFGLQPQMGDPTHKVALSRSVMELLIAGHSFKIMRYGPSYIHGGQGLGKRLVRGVRAVLRGLINRALNFIYATKIPYDPVVVIVLERAEKDEVSG